MILQSAKPASWETINNLMQNSANMISSLYAGISEEVAALRTLEASGDSQLLIYAHQLHIAVSYSLIDLGVSVRASLGTDKPLEKRFHLKNLMASISESFKVIMNFDKARKKSLWTKLNGELHNVGTPAILALYDDITKKLEAFGNTYIDQDLRNLTLHYDDNMMRVYEATVGINDEDKTLKVFIEYVDILRLILVFSDLLVSSDRPCAEQTGNTDQVEIDSIINGYFKQTLNNNDRLKDVLDKVIDGEGHGIDSIADNIRRFARLELWMKDNGMPFVPELESVKILMNAELLIGFMMGDLSSVTKAYLRSESEAESKMNLRRYIVIKTSTLVHLYGYDQGEKDNSVWRLLMSCIPQDETALLDEATMLEKRLKTLITSSDKQERALYVHLVNNSNSKFVVPDTLSAIDAIGPIVKIAQTQEVLYVAKNVRILLRKIMDVLSRRAKEANMQSTQKLEAWFSEIIGMLNKSKLPQETKTQLRDSIEKLRSTVSEI